MVISRFLFIGEDWWGAYCTVLSKIWEFRQKNVICTLFGTSLGFGLMAIGIFHFCHLGPWSLIWSSVKLGLEQRFVPQWDLVPSRSSLLWGQEGIFGQLSHKCPFYSPGTYTVFSCHASLISSNLGHFVNLSELDTGRVLAIILQNIPQPGFVWCLLMIRLRLWMLCLSQDVISGGRWC